MINNLSEYKKKVLNSLAQHFRTFGVNEQDEEDYCIKFRDQKYYLVDYDWRPAYDFCFYREFNELSNNEAFNLAFEMLPKHVLISDLQQSIEEKQRTTSE